MKLIEVKIATVEDLESGGIIIHKFIEEYEAQGPADAYRQAREEYPEARLIEVVGAVA